MTKILVIEDENMLREEIGDLLRFEGHEVITAKDGAEGVEFAFRELPDLIICDILMPKLDGYGVLLEIRANPATAAVPFIFMTAKVAKEDIRQGMILGADDYLTKPFDRMDLLESIQARLDKQATLEQKYQQDLEQLKNALDQEHEQRLLKTKMVAMFSHDFRNPLAAIMSSMSILRDYADRMDEQHRLTHLNRVEASARQLLQMLDDMLFLVEMETNSIVTRLEPLNVRTFLNGIVDEFQVICGETHTLVYEDHFSNTVMADPRLLRQIAANLISNAIKYSPQNSEILVRLDNGNNHFALTVEDHGIGIPEADQPRLFAAFQRGANAKSIAGTGLGLAIVKQAVDLLGASIKLESQVGVGTMVTVYIPITD